MKAVRCFHQATSISIFMEAATLPSHLRKDGLEKVDPNTGVLYNTVEILKLALESLMRLIAHLLRAVALGVR